MCNKNLERVKRNGLYLILINEQIPEICLAALKKNGKALKYIQENMLNKKRTLYF